MKIIPEDSSGFSEIIPRILRASKGEDFQK
jgi:hypothetical protein